VADTIPVDNHVIGDSGHVTDHNNIADILGLYGQALAQQASGLVSATNATNVAQILAWVNNSQYANSENLAHQLSTSVTAASLTTIASATYEANDAQVGSYYEMDVWGNGTTGSSASDSLEFSLSLGGTAMTNITFGTAWFGSVSGGQAFRWRALCRVICVTTGSGATWNSFIDATLSAFGNNQLGNNGTQMTGSSISCESSGTTAVSSASNQTVALQCAWSATTGSPTLTSRWMIKKGLV
jgi:hypothetical protein